MTRWPIALCMLAACVRPGEERALEDLEVGAAEADGLTIDVDDGAAAVRRLEAGRIDLWAQAPALRAVVRAPGGGDTTRLTVKNCMPDAELTALDADGDPIAVTILARSRPTDCRYDLALPVGDTTLLLAPPDAGSADRFRFAAMGDIQTALPSVDEVFDRINDEPGLRFVISMGDLVEDGLLAEYDLLLDKLGLLDIPYFSTIGNHELRDNLDRWHDLLGRYNVHFTFKDTAFSFVDSGNASIDPMVHDWLDGWLDDARDDVHVFGTHYPPIDPVGARAGAFRSRKEAAKLLAHLADGEVDLTLYGHIHSYYAFDNAGIPAFISGGGGALPEKLDGIGRHFLVVEVAPGVGIDSVAVVRVDD
ncbi:MAG TPA: metallophosphoesterase [Kofleriaceae bacterium]|nr:metallophosphoesterase [Kofleriaceae bacterium]